MTIRRKKRVRSTKTAERAEQLKKYRKIRRKLAAKRAAKRAVKRVSKTHPHRKASAMRGRR